MNRGGRLWRVPVRPALSARETEQVIQGGVGIDASDGDTVLVVDHAQDEDAARQRVLDLVDGDPDRVLAVRPWAARRVAS